MNLSFNHNLAKVTVTIDSWSNEFSANERVANALELNSLSSVMSNYGTVSGDEAAKWVKAYVAQENTAFVAIIAPGTYASGDDIMQVYVNGSSTPLAVKTSSALTIESGKAYRFKLSVGKDLVAITSSVTINGWEDEVLDNQEIIVNLNTSVPYVDELGIMQGYGVEIDGAVWAPVNCGYHETDYPYGKLYQWGRKYGQGYGGAFYKNSINEGEYTDSQVAVISEGPVELSVGQDVQNEKCFYTSKNTTIWSPQINDLWNKGTYDSVIKSEYDPCPDGWRVPTFAELDALALNRSSWTTNDAGQEGYFFSGSKAYSNAGPRVFFPAAGSIDFGTGVADGRGLRGEYWSVDYEGSKYGGAYGLGFNNKQAGHSPYNRAEGNSVRCVKDKNWEEPSESQIINLSEEGTANSYIVSESGSYKFTPTKGNSSTPVGSIKSVEVLWESFGTNVTPNVGDLVKNVKYVDGVISFETPSTFKEGNAVIAAKDASGTILWSWHIWLTDQPEEHVYYNNAGTMMDRNLGATSATPGDVGALGLLYQWGRKDPFLGSSSIFNDSMIKACSTISWPSTANSNTTDGTIEYATANPTTFIHYNMNSNIYNNWDWYFTGSTKTDKTRWQSEKTIYDPCPYGWRVPNGGNDGVWVTALASNSWIYDHNIDAQNVGINFSGMLGEDACIWYPLSGYLRSDNGHLYSVGQSMMSWSCTSSDSNNHGCDFEFISSGTIRPSSTYYRATASSVRCLKE